MSAYGHVRYIVEPVEGARQIDSAIVGIKLLQCSGLDGEVYSIPGPPRAQDIHDMVGVQQTSAMRRRESRHWYARLTSALTQQLGRLKRRRSNGHGQHTRHQRLQQFLSYLGLTEIERHVATVAWLAAREPRLAVLLDMHARERAPVALGDLAVVLDTTDCMIAEALDRDGRISRMGLMSAPQATTAVGIGPMPPLLAALIEDHDIQACDVMGRYDHHRSIALP